MFSRLIAMPRTLNRVEARHRRFEVPSIVRFRGREVALRNFTTRDKRDARIRINTVWRNALGLLFRLNYPV